MNPKPLILLDLEQTLIPIWGEWTLIERTLPLIQECVEASDADIGLMSWAVHDMKDKDTFNARIRPAIEEALGRPFSTVWSMDNWAHNLFSCSCLVLDKDDLFDIYKKEDVLFRMLRHRDPAMNRPVILIDDAVDATLGIRSSFGSVDFVNPWTAIEKGCTARDILAVLS